MNALRLHALALSDALRRLAAQPVATAFSLLVLATALALPVIAAVALRSIGTAAAGLDTDPHVNVFLALDAGDDDVRRVEQALKAIPGVAAVRFTSRTQAFEELRSSTHLAEILATFDRNPLPHAFTARVSSEALERAAAIRDAAARIPKVEQVTADFEWAQRLARWVRLGERIVSFLAIVLGAAVAFIVGHLIRLQALTRRAEIEVSQLIGATAADVRRPLLYHGLLQGALAGTLALGLAAALGAWIGAEMLALAPAYATELKVVFLGPKECGLAIAIAAGLGLAGAWIAAHREIRRFTAG